MFKLKKVLYKTNFDKNLIEIEDILKGHPSVILKIIHHLIFKSSEIFTDHILESF